MLNRFSTFISTQYKLINEARKQDISNVKYTSMKDTAGRKPSTSKDDVKMILAELSGKESEAVTKFAKELQEANETFAKAKLALDDMKDKAIEIDDQYFDTMDGIYSRMIRTASLVVKYSKYKKTEKEQLEVAYSLKKVDEVKTIVKMVGELLDNQSKEIAKIVKPMLDEIFEIKESTEIRKIPSVSNIDESIGDKLSQTYKRVSAYVNSVLKGAFSGIKSFFATNDKDLDKADEQLAKLEKILQATKKDVDKK